MIRQAAFKALREDKKARDVVAEIPASAAADPNATKPVKAIIRRTKIGRAPSTTNADPPSDPSVVLGVTISKPDKALWPNAGDGVPVTKLDLAKYYELVGEWMLPHVIGRPCSLVRVPSGLGSGQFFQRHAMPGMSEFLSSVKVKGDKEPYVQIDRIEALGAAAQIAALEIHPWNCAPGDPEVAGRLVFDLDPAPDVEFAAVIAAALEIRDRLDAVGLESFCKTTGGKGLHVVVPLTVGKSAIEWPVAKNFAHMICAQMAEDSPSRYLDNMSKLKRTGKIFLDYLRNDRTATAVAVLSPRARDGAPVSMPIHWREARAGLDPKKFTVRSAPALLRKSKPWEGYAKAARSLSAAIRAVTQTGTRKRRR
jgi:bifunctional non-homologous end joining protein LigD